MPLLTTAITSVANSSSCPDQRHPSHPCFFSRFILVLITQRFFFSLYSPRAVWPEPRQWLHAAQWLGHCRQQRVHPGLDSARAGQGLWQPQGRALLRARAWPLPPPALRPLQGVPQSHDPQLLLRGLHGEQLRRGGGLRDYCVLHSPLQGVRRLCGLEDAGVLP